MAGGAVQRRWSIAAPITGNVEFQSVRFGTDLGNMTPSLQFEKGLKFSDSSKLINILIVLAIIALFIFVFIKWKRVITIVLLTGAIAMGGMSVVNINTINTSISKILKHIK